MADVNSKSCRICSFTEQQIEIFSGFFKCSACGSIYGAARATASRFDNYWLSGIPASGLKHYLGMAWYWLVRYPRSKHRQLAYVEWLTKHCDFAKISSVLDVGCGQGFLLRSFDSRGLDTLGVEPDSAVPKVAHNIDIGYFGKTSAIPRRFDLVVAGQVICYWDDANQTMNDLLDTVAPGGYVFIATLNTDGVTSGDHDGLSANPIYLGRAALTSLLRAKSFQLVNEETFHQSDLSLSRSTAGPLVKTLAYIKLCLGWKLGHSFYLPGNGETVFWLAQKSSLSHPHSVSRRIRRVRSGSADLYRNVASR